jgi:hypothetical protein
VRSGEAGLGEVGYGWVGVPMAHLQIKNGEKKYGLARSGVVRCGVVGLAARAWPGVAGFGLGANGTFKSIEDEAWLGSVRRGTVRLGRVRSGQAWLGQVWVPMAHLQIESSGVCCGKVPLGTLRLGCMVRYGLGANGTFTSQE